MPDEPFEQRARAWQPGDLEELDKLHLDMNFSSSQDSSFEIDVATYSDIMWACKHLIHHAEMRPYYRALFPLQFGRAKFAVDDMPRVTECIYLVKVAMSWIEHCQIVLEENGLKDNRVPLLRNEAIWLYDDLGDSFLALAAKQGVTSKYDVEDYVWSWGMPYHDFPLPSGVEKQSLINEIVEDLRVEEKLDGSEEVEVEIKQEPLSP